MGKSKTKKLLKRLDRMERVVRKHDDRERRRRAKQGASGDAGGGVRAHGGFEEKRVIDTIVRLVVERVARVVQRENQIQSRHDDSCRADDGRRHRECDHHGAPRSGRRDDGRRDGDRDGGDGRRDRGRDERRQRDERGGRDRGDSRDGEKRVVDLIVGLVSEHVEEIVSSELDRRIGPPRPDREVDPEVLPPEEADAADAADEES